MSSINREIKRLAKSLCANYYGDNRCLLKPNGQSTCNFFREDAQAMPYIEAATMDCGYFRRAVLPSDPVLESRYFGQSTSSDADKRRSCARCGETFVRRSNAAKYCRSCAGLVRRDKSREAKRKARANVSK